MVKRARIGVVAKYADYAGVTRVAYRLSEFLSLAGASVNLIFLRGKPIWTGTGFEVRSYRTGSAERVSQALGSPLLKLLPPGHFGAGSSPDILSWTVDGLFRGWRSTFDFVVFADENLATFAQFSVRLPGIRYAVVVHDLSNTGWPIIDRARSRAIKGAQFLLSPSPSVTDFLSSAYNLPVFFTGLARPNPPKESSDSEFVLLDTRWTPDRNPAFVLDIMDVESAASYVMAGRFESVAERNLFERALQVRGHSGRLKVANRLEEEELLGLYRTASAYVRWPEIQHGIVHEHGIGWGIIMAIENGCPIIIDNRMGFARFVKNGENGYAVPHTAAAFAEAISSLTKNRAARLDLRTSNEGLRNFLMSELL